MRTKTPAPKTTFDCRIRGGDRYSPIDTQATMVHPDKEVQYDERNAFSKQLSPIFLSHFTVSYKINRKRVAHEFAIKVLNATGYEEYFGHGYNFKKQEISEMREGITMPNISYKIEF